jgi:hypothetical protein
MGMRLDGPLLQHRGGWDIVSDAIATGAIQVPGSGQPIVLLADHQTTGGYPKIASVILADLPLVGRRRPGDLIRFAAVTVEAAEALCRAEERGLVELVAALEPVTQGGRIDLASLYGKKPRQRRRQRHWLTAPQIAKNRSDDWSFGSVSKASLGCEKQARDLESLVRGGRHWHARRYAHQGGTTTSLLSS